MTRPPEPPAEGMLIESARREAGLSVREAARRAGISEGWWRQVVKGYQSMAGGAFGIVRAPAETVADMARVVSVTPEDMETGGRRADAAEVMRQEARPRPVPAGRPEVDLAGDDPDSLYPFIQEILRSAYGILGVLDRLPADDLPDPSEYPNGESDVSALPGGMLFPGSPRDAETWDSPGFTLRQKLDVIARGHRLGAAMDERQQGRRTGLAVPALLSVAGGTSRASH